MLSTRTVNGYRTMLTYSGSGEQELTTVTDVASGRTLSFGWNASKKRVTSVTDQAVPPRTVLYGYDGEEGDLVSVTDVAGNKTGFGYEVQNGLHLLTSKRYPKQANSSPQGTANDVVSVYQGGRVVSQTDNRVSPAMVTTFDYAVAGLPVQDPNDPDGATKVTVKAAGPRRRVSRVSTSTLTVSALGSRRAPGSR